MSEPMMKNHESQRAESVEIRPKIDKTSSCEFKENNEITKGVSKNALLHFSSFVGILGVFIGNVIALATHIDQLAALVSKYFHFDMFLGVNKSSGLIIIVGILALYILAATLFYNYFIKRVHVLVRASFLIVTVSILCISSFALYKNVQPSQIDKNVLKSRNQLVDSIYLKQTISKGQSHGGFRFSQDSLSDDVQPWTSAQCLIAITSQENDNLRGKQQLINDGIEFLRRTKIPHDGWGYLINIGSPASGITEVTSWVTLAMNYYYHYIKNTSLDNKFQDRFGLQSEVRENISILIDRQLDIGGWAPIGQTSNPRHIRTYSTVMALWAITEAYRSGLLAPDLKIKSEIAIRNGIRFLLETYKTNEDGLSGWWPNPNTQPQVDFFPGLTAQTLFMLVEAVALFPDNMVSVRLENAINEFTEISIHGNANSDSLVNQKISENQRLHDSDRYLDGRTEMVEGSTFLWYPWSLILAIDLHEKARNLFKLKVDPQILIDALLANNGDAFIFASKDPVIYPSAEITFAFNKAISFRTRTTLRRKSQ